MAAPLRKRPCRLCRRWFLPHVRLGERQYACPAPACQALRQAHNQRAWLEAAPGYFRGRAAKHRSYRQTHPNAKRDWRARHPEARDRERLARARRRQKGPTRRAVEQEAMVLQLTALKGVANGHAPAVAQESLRSQLRVLVGLASALAPAVAQEPIAGALLAWNDRGRHLLAGAAAREPVRTR